MVLEMTQSLKFIYITLVRGFVHLCPGGKELKLLSKGLFHHLRPDELNISTGWKQHRRYKKDNAY